MAGARVDEVDVGLLLGRPRMDTEEWWNGAENQQRQDIMVASSGGSGATVADGVFGREWTKEPS